MNKLAKIWILTNKELKDYFSTPMAYIVLGTFGLIAGGYFSRVIFLENQASLRTLFEFIPMLWVVLIPAMTMRSFAEERKTGTLEVITTLPVERMDIIYAKVLTSWIMSLGMLVLTIPALVTVLVMGDPDIGEMAAGYIGLTFLSLTYILIGTFISLNSKNQIVAFIICVFVIAIWYFIGEAFVLEQIPLSIRPLVEFSSLGSHFRSMARGVLDTRDLVYYISIVVLMLLLTDLSYKRIISKGR